MIRPLALEEVDGDVQIAPTKMLEEEKVILENKKKAIDALLERECIGKYKIEVMFSHKRSWAKPTPGMLSIWESGAKLNGGGDATVYFCPGRDKGITDCASPIPFDNCNYGFVLCPVCKKVWKPLDVYQNILGNWTLQQWAEKLVYYYAMLGHNADLYLKQPRADIRKAAELEQERQRGGEKLGQVRRGLIKTIYPLARIVKDTNNGSDIYSRFLAFLKS